MLEYDFKIILQLFSLKNVFNIYLIFISAETIFDIKMLRLFEEYEHCFSLQRFKGFLNLAISAIEVAYEILPSMQGSLAL